MASASVFDIDLINQYTQPELHQFVRDQGIEHLVTGRRTILNLKAALQQHATATIGHTGSSALVFDISQLMSYTRQDLLDFCIQLGCSPHGINRSPTKADLQTALQNHHDQTQNPLPLQLPPMKLNPMFDTMEDGTPSTLISDDSAWQQSFEFISQQRSAATPTAPAFLDLLPTPRKDVSQNRFVLLFHVDGDLSIYCAENSSNLVLRTNDYGALKTPTVVWLDEQVMTWMLQPNAVDRYKRLAQTSTTGFSFNDVTRVINPKKRSHEEDEEIDEVHITGDSSTQNQHLLAFAKLINSNTSKNLTARGQHMSDTAARSLTTNPERLLTTGALIFFQQLKYPPPSSPIPHRWFGDDWQRNDEFLVQLQCGHILKLFSSWDAVPIGYFADLLGKYDNLQAQMISTRINQAVNSSFDIDPDIPLEDIIGNDFQLFNKALTNFGYVLDSVYGLRSQIAVAIRDMFKRVIAFIRHKTLGPHNNGTSLIFMAVTFHIQKCMQDIYLTIFANTEVTSTQSIVLAFANAPDLSSNGSLSQHLNMIQLQHQTSLPFLAQVAIPAKKNAKAKKSAAATLSAATLSPIGNTSSTNATPSAVAATPATGKSITVVTSNTPICGWYLANKCLKNPCNRAHRNPLPADASEVTDFFTKRTSMKQKIF